ncbi:MAG: thioredoxin [Bacilli bacterium]|nr:thioredoxin [Bacilli bacterium]
MKKVEGTVENFDALIKGDFVLVKFFATWCGPCKMLTPIVEEVVEEMNVNLVEVDIDNSVEIASRYAVMSVPTMMIFKKGELVSSNIGFIPKEALQKWITENK